MSGKFAQLVGGLGQLFLASFETAALRPPQDEVSL
jgi:hypothetical protein